MSKNVDVLQWLSDERFMYGAGTHSRMQCNEVYAAVVELIEADKEYDAMVSRSAKYPCPGMDEHVEIARKRRASALARVGGVA